LIEIHPDHSHLPPKRVSNNTDEPELFGTTNFEPCFTTKTQKKITKATKQIESKDLNQRIFVAFVIFFCVFVVKQGY
jgi:hypothetical protein